MAQAKPNPFSGANPALPQAVAVAPGTDVPASDFATFYPKSPHKEIDELRVLKRKQLLQIAAAARSLAEVDLTKENFHRLVKIAYDQRVIAPEDLARLGLSDRSSASRWISGVSAPNAVTQTLVLQRIATMAELSAQAI